MLEKIDSLCKEKRQKIIVSKDKGSPCVHPAVNVDSNLVRQYRIDGDLITDKTTVRCDYLVLNDEKENAYLIELKGKNILHALEQLENTEKMLREELKSYTFWFRIVSHSNTHAVRSSEYTKFSRRWGGRVKAATDKMEENI